MSKTTIAILNSLAVAYVLSGILAFGHACKYLPQSENDFGARTIEAIFSAVLSPFYWSWYFWS